MRRTLLGIMRCQMGEERRAMSDSFKTTSSEQG
jgi:hypothetical protein